jgi:hypothetical protein
VYDSDLLSISHSIACLEYGIGYGILLICVTREEKSQPDLSTILAEGAGKPSWCCVALP